MLPEDFSSVVSCEPRLKDQYSESLPREKALNKGIDSLMVSELWALVLRTGMPGYPITKLCEELMRANNNSLHDVERQPRELLMNVRGIGEAKALQIEAVMELIRRYNTETPEAPEHIRRSEDIYRVMRPIIGNLPHEEIWLLLLNQNNTVRRKICITQGSSIASVFDTKKVLRAALFENCHIMALCHNHPSGNTSPSPQDDTLTSKLNAACKYLDFRLIDHVIVTANGYFSYADSGRL